MSSTVRPRAARAPTAPYRFAAAVGAAVLAVLVADPVHRHIPLSPLREATGLLCPLCGGLRAVDELAHGQLATALRDNLLVVAAVPVAVAVWVDWLLRARSGRAPRRFPRAARVALVVLAGVFTLVRNLPAASALRP